MSVNIKYDAKVKYLSLIDNEFIEDINGGIPCLEWTDQFGDSKRAFPFECYFDLRKRTFRVDYLTQIQIKSGNWVNDKTLIYSPETNDKSFVNKNTGLLESNPWMNDETKPIYSETPLDPEGRPLHGIKPVFLGFEKKLKPNLISESQYFINNVGKNINNVSISLFEYFLNVIIRKENLKIVE